MMTRRPYSIATPVIARMRVRAKRSLIACVASSTARVGLSHNVSVNPCFPPAPLGRAASFGQRGG
jgi:hypothetical protein